MALAAAVPAQAVELVTNGGFETGNFAGWTQFGGTDYTGVNNDLVDTGSLSAEFGPTSPGGIRQSLATTAGQSYTVNFAFSGDGDSSQNSFSASFGGQQLVSLNNVGGGGYTHYSFTPTATAASSELSFSFFDPPAYLYLDSVSVQSAGSGPGAPAPLLGLGVLPALASFGGLGLTRLRRRKQAEA